MTGSRCFWYRFTPSLLSIYFAPNRLNLSDEGIALIAHELLHVKQYNDAGGPREFLRQYFKEFKERIEAQIGPLNNFPTLPAGSAPSTLGVDEVAPYLAKLGAYLGGLQGVDFVKANQEISFERDAYQFGAKINKKLAANGNPCLNK